MHVPPLAVHDAALRKFGIVSFNSAETSDSEVLAAWLYADLRLQFEHRASAALSSVKGWGPTIEIKQNN